MSPMVATPAYELALTLQACDLSLHDGCFFLHLRTHRYTMRARSPHLHIELTLMLQACDLSLHDY